jgi:hypothetical protein
MIKALLLLFLTINISFVCSNSLVFLGEEQSFPVELPIEPVVDAAEFAEGFYEGFSIFNNLPFQAPCEGKGQLLLGDVVAVYNLLKTINKDTDFSHLLIDVLAKVSDGYQQVLVMKEFCQEWFGQVEKTVNGLIQYVQKESYLERLTFHAFTSIGKIQEAITAGIDFVKAKNFRDGGKKFGGIAKEIFFWDYKS